MEKESKMKIDFKKLIKSDIVKGLNVEALAKGALMSAKEGALEKVSGMVATNPEIQARAGKMVEKQAVAGLAGTIADFYTKHKMIVIGGGAGVVLLTFYFLIRGLIKR
jgi:hypothetical protein